MWGGAYTIEAKLEQHLAGICNEPLFKVILDVWENLCISGQNVLHGSPVRVRPWCEPPIDP